MTPKELIQAIADETDGARNPISGGMVARMDAEHMHGHISHEKAERMMKLSRKAGIFEARGLLEAVIDRSGKIVAYKLTDKGRERTREMEERRA